MNKTPKRSKENNIFFNEWKKIQDDKKKIKEREKKLARDIYQNKNK